MLNNIKHFLFYLHIFLFTYFGEFSVTVKSLHSRFLFVPYAYVSIAPLDCCYLSLLALNAILSTSSGNT